MRHFTEEEREAIMIMAKAVQEAAGDVAMCAHCMSDEILQEAIEAMQSAAIGV